MYVRAGARANVPRLCVAVHGCGCGTCSDCRDRPALIPKYHSHDECARVLQSIAHDVRTWVTHMCQAAGMRASDIRRIANMPPETGDVKANHIVDMCDIDLPHAVTKAFLASQTWRQAFGPSEHGVALGIRFNQELLACAMPESILQFVRALAGLPDETLAVKASLPALLGVRNLSDDNPAFRVTYFFFSPYEALFRQAQTMGPRSHFCSNASKLCSSAVGDMMRAVRACKRQAVITCVDNDMPADASTLEVLTVPETLATILVAVRLNFAVFEPGSSENVTRLKALRGSIFSEPLATTYMTLPASDYDMLSPDELKNLLSLVASVLRGERMKRGCTGTATAQSMATALCGAYEATVVPPEVAGAAARTCAATERVLADIDALLRRDMPTWHPVTLRRGDVLVIPAAVTFVRFTSRAAHVSLPATGSALLSLQLLDTDGGALSDKASDTRIAAYRTLNATPFFVDRTLFPDACLETNVASTLPDECFQWTDNTGVTRAGVLHEKISGSAKPVRMLVLHALSDMQQRAIGGNLVLPLPDVPPFSVVPVQVRGAQITRLQRTTRGASALGHVRAELDKAHAGAGASSGASASSGAPSDAGAASGADALSGAPSGADASSGAGANEEAVSRTRRALSQRARARLDADEYMHAATQDDARGMTMTASVLDSKVAQLDTTPISRRQGVARVVAPASKRVCTATAVNASDMSSLLSVLPPTSTVAAAEPLAPQPLAPQPPTAEPVATKPPTAEPVATKPSAPQPLAVIPSAMGHVAGSATVAKPAPSTKKRGPLPEVTPKELLDFHARIANDKSLLTTPVTKYNPTARELLDDILPLDKNVTEQVHNVKKVLEKFKFDMSDLSFDISGPISFSTALIGRLSHIWIAQDFMGDGARKPASEAERAWVSKLIPPPRLETVFGDHKLVRMTFHINMPLRVRVKGGPAPESDDLKLNPALLDMCYLDWSHYFWEGPYRTEFENVVRAIWYYRPKLVKVIKDEGDDTFLVAVRVPSRMSTTIPRTQLLPVVRKLRSIYTRDEFVLSWTPKIEPPCDICMEDAKRLMRMGDLDGAEREDD